MISLSPHWCSGAVLQHGAVQQLSGQAAAHSVIDITLSSPSQTITVQCQADNTGCWQAELPAQPPSGPYTLTLCAPAQPTLSYQDLWFGELLLFAGQSNVGWPLAQYPAQLAAAQQMLSTASGSRDDIRCFLSDPTDFRAPGRWQTLDANHCAQWPALLYHFANHCPQTTLRFGLVDLSWPGSAMDAWSATAAGAPAQHAWQAGALFSARLAPWLARPFNTLVWYQGEQDAMSRQADAYAGKLQAWITSCRQYAQWELPLILVQIAGFGASLPAKPKDGFVQVRQAQQQLAASTPNCALVCAADLGDATDIHPAHKAELARRLMLTWVALRSANAAAHAQAPAKVGLLEATLLRDDQTTGAYQLQLPDLTDGDHWQNYPTTESAAASSLRHAAPDSGFYCLTDTAQCLAVAVTCHANYLHMHLPQQARWLAYGMAPNPQLCWYTSEGLPLLPQIWQLDDL